MMMDWIDPVDQRDRAVSPVISVLLLVVITALMAGVMGVFVLGMGDSETPEATITFEYTDNSETLGVNDTLRITHEQGDEIPAANLSITATNVYNQTKTGMKPVTTTQGDLFGTTGTVAPGDTTTLTAGLIGATETGEVTENGDLLLNESTVQVVYTSDDGEKTAVLAEWTGPDG